jgi:hypothetical protein
MLLSDPLITTDELRRSLQAGGIEASALLLASVKASFRADLRFLIDEGILDASVLESIQYRPQERELRPLFKKKRFKPWWFNG